MTVYEMFQPNRGQHPIQANSPCLWLNLGRVAHGIMGAVREMERTCETRHHVISRRRRCGCYNVCTTHSLSLTHASTREEACTRSDVGAAQASSPESSRGKGLRWSGLVTSALSQSINQSISQWEAIQSTGDRHCSQSAVCPPISRYQMQRRPLYQLACPFITEPGLDEGEKMTATTKKSSPSEKCDGYVIQVHHVRTPDRDDTRMYRCCSRLHLLHQPQNNYME
ncbi:unnamed protein product [Periconia digitata]|uniref:Uncharacterized protein n=1 Tax=Periconia digitata TaxID=1303443 RepID=A0A9W4U133_9PLEO|nr:unnamed protein product [Periconia digitata]